MIKVLIIKLGYSETLDPEIGKVPSLGDVLRTTPILLALREKYDDAHITWLVSEQSVPLLYGNPFIDRILVWDEFIPFQLMREKFDVLINLEKIPGVAALADMIDAWTRYGFRFESINGNYHAYEKGINFIHYIENKKANKKNDCWQKILIEMLGVEWRGQEYILGYKPSTEEAYDIGFNFEVGSKWPVKAFPMEKWRVLEQELLDLGFSISWQDGKDNLYRYMDWLNSCRLIVSNDSLGLHLAFALKKKVVGLFGPTGPEEVFFYGDSRYIASRVDCPVKPCYSSRCINGIECMGAIKVEQVVRAVVELMQKERAIVQTG